MKFSVVIPAYNCADTIADTVESIRHSGLEDYEIIIVNDGSTDQTAEVLALLCAQDPALVILDQPNGGVSSARNNGLAHARGDYLVFVDADDRVEENSYCRAAQIIREQQPDMLLFGMRVRYYSNGACYFTEDLVCPAAGLLPAAEWEPQLETLFRCNYLSPIWNKMIRREITVRNGVRFREDMFLMEDCRFSLDCLQFCDTVYLLPEAVYTYQLLDDGRKAGVRLGRLHSLSEFMAHFEGLPPAFSGVVREVYYLLLAQRLSGATKIAQLRAEEEDFRRSPFWEQPPESAKTIQALKAGDFRTILRSNRKYKLRHRAAILYRRLKLRLRSDAAGQK